MNNEKRPITIKTRRHTNKGVAGCLILTHYPNSEERDIVEFLNKRGMRQVLSIPQRMNEYQIMK